MNIDSITNGIVIDHIPAGGAMKLYELLHLDTLPLSKTHTAARMERRT